MKMRMLRESVLLTSCIEGMHSTIIKRLVQRSNPGDQTALREAAIRAVANERTAYRAGYAESTSLDGLENHNAGGLSRLRQWRC